MRRVALVTGATGGIGWELCQLLAKDGTDMGLVARNQERLEQRANQLETQFPIKTWVISADLSQPGSVTDLIRELAREKLVVDCLINNAGFGDYGAFAASDLTKQLGMIQVNIAALTELTHRLLPAMLERGRGRILNLASTAAFQPGPLMAVYYATKAYVLSFSEALSEELRGSGVTVTALCPGPTRSDFQRAAEMKPIRLMAGRSLPSAAEVAAVGYRAMLAGQPLVIHGAQNTLAAWLIRLAPRALVRRTVYWLHQEVDCGSR